MDDLGVPGGGEGGGLGLGLGGGLELLILDQTEANRTKGKKMYFLGLSSLVSCTTQYLISTA